MSSLDVRDGIGLRWYPQDGLESYYTEIAFDLEFQNIAADSTGSANWTQLMPAPAPGTYYWRVTAQTSDSSPVPVSEIRSFTVRPLEGTVELITPPPGGVGEAEPYSPYDFTWRSEVPGSSRFLLKRQDGGEGIRLIETLVEGSRFTAPLPGEGNYIWQIQIVDDRGRILAESTEGGFRISSSFLPPVLNNQEPETAISLVGSDSAVVRWNPALGADAYKAVLKNPDGISLGQTDRVRSLTAEFALPQKARPGRYTVELQSIRDNPPAGFPGVSQAASYGFTIGELIRYQASVPASPADGSRIDGLTALRNGVVLQWTQEPLLTSWTVELVSGGITRLYRTSSPRLVLPQLETGRYRWRVPRDSLGREAPEGPFAGFTVGGIPGPSEPVPVFPTPGQNIDMAARSSLDFEWRPSAQEADFYEVALYAGDSTIPLLSDTTVTGTRFSLTNLGILDVGDFSLTLRARKEHTDLGITRYSPVVRIPFTLSLDIAEAAPTILTEELQYAE